LHLAPPHSNGALYLPKERERFNFKIAVISVMAKAIKIAKVSTSFYCGIVLECSISQVVVGESRKNMLFRLLNNVFSPPQTFY